MSWQHLAGAFKHVADRGGAGERRVAGLEMGDQFRGEERRIRDPAGHHHIGAAGDRLDRKSVV